MSLTDVRAAAKTAIKTLPQFSAAGVGSVPERVYTSPLRNYNGLAPLALLTTSGLERLMVGRGTYQRIYSFDLDVLVRSEPGEEAAAEETHDAVLEAIIPALEAADFTVGRADGTPRGNPLITSEDGYTYRYTRIPVSYTE
jgi:hypothetical protein